MSTNTTIGKPVRVVGRFQKQPDEILDYDVDFGPWFSNRDDEPAAVDPIDVTGSDGITLVSSSITGNVVKVILSGGTADTTYKVTVLLTTSAGLVKEADFEVKVKAV